VRLVAAAALTPHGDVAATIAAIRAGRSIGAGGARDPETGLRVARLVAAPASARNARMLGALPALALDVAARAVGERTPGPRTGAFVATGGLRAHWQDLAPAMAEQTADAARAWSRGLARLHPLWMLRYLANGAHALLAAELGAIGDGATFAGPTAAASALVAAEAALAARTIDRAIVVAFDDVAADEVAIELAARRPELVPGAGVAAIVVDRDGPGAHLSAADGVDPEHAEPSRAAIARVRARLADADREVGFAESTGWLGAAQLLVDLIVAARIVPTSAIVTAAASPGQIGVARVEAAT
jgi:hypothetical protein